MVVKVLLSVQSVYHFKSGSPSVFSRSKGWALPRDIKLVVSSCRLPRLNENFTSLLIFDV